MINYYFFICVTKATRAVGGQPRSTISKFVTNELFQTKKGQNFTQFKACDIPILSIAI